MKHPLPFIVLLALPATLAHAANWTNAAADHFSNTAANWNPAASNPDTITVASPDELIIANNNAPLAVRQLVINSGITATLSSLLAETLHVGQNGILNDGNGLTLKAPLLVTENQNWDLGAGRLALQNLSQINASVTALLETGASVQFSASGKYNPDWAGELNFIGDVSTTSLRVTGDALTAQNIGKIKVYNHATELRGDYIIAPDAPRLAVSPNTQTVVGEASGTLSFNITNAYTGTLNWSASVPDGGSWLRITSASSGSCDSGAYASLTVAYDTNPLDSPARSANLVISAPGADNPLVTIPVSQVAGGSSQPPSIVGDNLPPVTNASGNNASLSITATGVPSPLIQWQQLVDGVWVDITGATSETLLLNNLKYNNNGDQYRARITNDSGTIYSDTTALAGIPSVAPQIEWLPGSGSQTVAPGANATLKVNVLTNAADTGALLYNWKKNNRLIPDASGPALSISNIYSISDTYAVTATGPDGKSASLTATVGVSDPYEPNAIAGLSTKGVKLAVPKSLSDQLKGVKLEKGTKAFYLWTDQNGTVLNKVDKKGNYVSATSYTTKTSGIFKVTLEYTPLGGAKITREHSFGVVKLFDPVKLPKTNAFVSSPLGVVVNDTKGKAVVDAVVEGEQLKLTVKLESGTGPLKYTWYKNKVLASNILQTTENTYALTDSFVTDAFPAKPDSFFVVIETHERSVKGGVKPLSSVKTKSIKPKVTLKPRITSITAKPAVLLATTKSVSISAKVTGTAKLTYEWKHNGEIVRDAKGAAINKSAITLKLPTGAAISTLAGAYTLKVTNASGPTHAAEATLTLAAPAQPAAPQQAAAQQPAAAQSVMECGDLSPLSTERLVAPPTPANPATTTLLSSQILALLLTADDGVQTTLYLTDPQTQTYATPDGETGAYTLLIATPSEFTTTPDAPPANPRAYTLRFETETTGTYTSPTGESGTFQIQ